VGESPTGKIVWAVLFLLIGVALNRSLVRKDTSRRVDKLRGLLRSELVGNYRSFLQSLGDESSDFSFETKQFDHYREQIDVLPPDEIAAISGAYDELSRSKSASSAPSSKRVVGEILVSSHQRITRALVALGGANEAAVEFSDYIVKASEGSDRLIDSLPECMRDIVATRMGSMLTQQVKAAEDACTVLMQCGEDYVEKYESELVALITRDSPSKCALKALSMVHKPDTKTVDAILRLIDTAGGARGEAMKTLEAYGAGILDQLIAGLRGPSATACTQVLRRLNSVAKDRLVDLLGQEEVQHDPDLHRHITNALGTKARLSFLRSELTKENSVVRHRNLLNALALVGPETFPQFIEVLMASSEELATNAVETLQQNSLWHNEKAQDEVMRLLKEVVSNQNYLCCKRLVKVSKLRFEPLISIFCETGDAQLRAFIDEELLKFIRTSPHGREIPTKIIVEYVAKEMRRWEEDVNVERFARAASFMKTLGEHGIKGLGSEVDTLRYKMFEKEIATALISFGPWL
jgi:hypothetical protein